MFSKMRRAENLFVIGKDTITNSSFIRHLQSTWKRDFMSGRTVGKMYFKAGVVISTSAKWLSDTGL